MLSGLRKSGIIHAFDVMEAIDRGAKSVGEIAEVSGYSASIALASIRHLRRCLCLPKIWGNYALTERGKIALAIYRGKQQRRFAQRRKRAA